jgi:hypothetical protein
MHGKFIHRQIVEICMTWLYGAGEAKRGRERRWRRAFALHTEMNEKEMFHQCKRVLVFAM